MKLPTDDELKKMTSQERQNFITDALAELKDRYDNPRLNKYIDNILKAYLLEKGEGIDVDFSKDVIHPIEIWLYELSKNINETYSHLDVMNQDTKVCAKKMFDAWSEFNKLITKDLKSKNKNFSDRLKNLI